jgi:hypothetical protein
MSDSDSGWTLCTPLEAHKAFVEDTHEIRHRILICLGDGSQKWTDWASLAKPNFVEQDNWQYEFRPKMQWVSVKIPAPHSVSKEHKSPGLYLIFKNDLQRNSAFLAFCAEIRKS